LVTSGKKTISANSGHHAYSSWLLHGQLGGHRTSFSLVTSTWIRSLPQSAMQPTQ
jgi:hypothetical protein